MIIVIALLFFALALCFVFGLFILNDSADDMFWGIIGGVLATVGFVGMIGLSMWIAKPVENVQRQKTPREVLATRLDKGGVVLINTAPDGTKLWLTRNRATGEDVYFSTGGASTDSRSVSASGKPL